MNAPARFTPAERIERAAVRMIRDNPFWGMLLGHLEREERHDIETMATDGKRLLWSPAFVSELSDKELVGVLAHEVQHCALGHMVRRGARDPQRWNVACDFAINADLVQSGFTLPAGALIDAAYDGLCAEQIYAQLPPPKQETEPRKGGAAGADPGRCGSVMDAAAPHETDKAAEAQETWQKAVSGAAAAARRAGKLPGSAERMVAEASKPSVDWPGILRRFLDQTAPDDYSWSAPNRRFIGQGIILPGMRSEDSDMRRLVLVVDTSGSIDVPLLRKVMAEVGQAIDDGIAEVVTVIYCDAAVRRVDTFARGDVMTPRPCGGAGTSFAPAFQWIAKHAYDASAVIYFTDMDATNFGKAPACPLIWAAYGNPNKLKALHSRAGFGELLEVRDNG